MDLNTLEVLGHVVAEDPFGDAVVIPLGPIMNGIREELNATSVKLRLVADIFSECHPDYGSNSADRDQKLPDNLELEKIPQNNLRAEFEPENIPEAQLTTKQFHDRGCILEPYRGVKQIDRCWLCCYCQLTWNSFTYNSHCTDCNHKSC